MKKNSANIDWLTIVLSDSPSGGAEQTQKNLITHLTETGKKCAVLILVKKKYAGWEDLESKCKVVYFPFESHFLGFLYLIPYLFFFFVKNRINYTFSSQTFVNFILGFYKKIGFLRKTKVVTRESTSIFKFFTGIKLKVYKMGYVLGYSSIDLVICQTSFMKDDLIESLPWLDKKTKIVVISNPINSKEIEQRAKEKLPQLPFKNFIVAAGRLVPAKAYDVLIDTYSKYQNNLGDCQLLILGDGPLRESLEQRVQKLKLEDKVTFYGMASNVYPFFKEAQLCVMSSRIEGFPNVLLQMMTQNQKIVSTLSAGDIDKIPEIYTCPVEDIDGLGNAMVNCYNSIDTTKRRAIFDSFLKERDMNSFERNILSHLK